MKYTEYAPQNSGLTLTKIIVEQTADTSGNDENGDGLVGGQITADTVGDVLGL